MRSNPVAALISACVGAGLLAACGGSDVGGGDMAAKEAALQNHQRWSADHLSLAESTLPGERGAGHRPQASMPSDGSPAPAPGAGAGEPSDGTVVSGIEASARCPAPRSPGSVLSASDR